MKKIICTAMVLTILVTLSGCGNYSAGIGNYKYTKVHVDTYHYSGCFEVEKWYESESGVEVKTKDGNSMFFSEGTYTMVKDACPFCGGEE